MTDEIPPTAKVQVVRAVIYGTVALAFLAIAAFAIAQKSGNYVLSLGKDGIGVTVSQNDDLATIIENTMNAADEKTKRAARAVLREEGIILLEDGEEDILTRQALRENGYFNVADIELPQHIAQLDYVEFAEMQAAFQKMLWNREGPFGSMTLRGAEAPFLTAFEELYDDLKLTGIPAPLLEVIWQRRNAWQSPFESHNFNAEITVLDDASSTGQIYVCEGAEHLMGKFVKISIPDPEDPRTLAQNTGTIEKKAVIDQRTFACDGGTKVSEMLSGNPVRIAMGSDLAQQVLLPGRGSGPLPETFEAQFVVRPLYLVSANEVASQ